MEILKKGFNKASYIEKFVQDTTLKPVNPKATIPQ